jgi:phenylpyruvate tautomerase PptA (4-oxalocrotonate tautomerase family)
MPLVEVFAPHGSVDPEQQSKISSMLVAEVLRGQDAPDIDVARSISWHDVPYWSVGGQPTNARETARYVVRISVPTEWMTDEKRADIVARVTRVLASADSRPDRLYRAPTAWVQLIETADSDWGTGSRVVRFAEVAGFGTLAAMD